jgi:hypothetical protein
MEAQARAIELETLSASHDARASCLTLRKFQIVRARFPWACDVKNVPAREDDYGFPANTPEQPLAAHLASATNGLGELRTMR